MDPKAVILAVFFCIAAASAVHMNYEKVLANELREHYANIGHAGRPVKHTKDVLKVKLGLTLVNINKVCHVSQTVSVAAFYILEWDDVNLTWDPKDFGGLKDVRIPLKDIWFPDIEIYNNAEGFDMFTGMEYTNAVVRHDGHVIFVPSGKATFTCAVPDPSDTSEFHCNLMIGSWTYHSEQIDVEAYAPEIDATFLQSNPFWKYLGSKVTREAKKYDCCPELYVHMNFDMRLKFTGKKMSHDEF